MFRLLLTRAYDELDFGRPGLRVHFCHHGGDYRKHQGGDLPGYFEGSLRISAFQCKIFTKSFEK